MTESLIDVIIIGAGRMGIRHALGVLDASVSGDIILIDISEESLQVAKGQLQSHPKFNTVAFTLLNDFQPVKADVVIISSTASNRLDTCRLAESCSPRSILIEKPLGQGISEVEELIDHFASFSGKVYVNLNTRLYSFVNKLKSDLRTLPQFVGPMNINFNGGSLGIGANGIHYLDLLFFLYGATDYKLVYAKIDKHMLPSGRGPGFGDFGGTAVIEFFKDQEYLGRASLTLSATSSVFGGWDIVGSHGRILINELEGRRTDILRDKDSMMPINRYAADYAPAKETRIESPLLNFITKEWLEGLETDEANLPELHESLKVHRLMFEWLNKSDTHKGIFPIT